MRFELISSTFETRYFYISTTVSSPSPRTNLQLKPTYGIRSTRWIYTPTKIRNPLVICQFIFVPTPSPTLYGRLVIDMDEFNSRTWVTCLIYIPTYPRVSRICFLEGFFVSDCTFDCVMRGWLVLFLIRSIYSTHSTNPPFQPHMSSAPSEMYVDGFYNLFHFRTNRNRW